MSKAARWAWRSPSFMIGAVLIGLLALCAVAAPVLAPYGPQEIGAGAPHEPPSAAHLFGTDRLGTDVLSRTLHAARVDLYIAISVVVVSAAVGIPLGTLFGFYGGTWDMAAMRGLEALQSFPPIVLAMAVLAVVRPSVNNVVAVIAVIAVPYYIRLVRAEVLSKRRWQFAEAATAVGNRPRRVAFVHILPNALSPAITYSSLAAGYALLTAAALGYLGLGLPPGSAEWGLMVREGAAGMIGGRWWIAFFPGLFISLAVLGFFLLGDGLRDLLDPHLAKKG